MKKVFKISKLVLLVLVSLIILFDLFIGFEGRSKIWPYIDTEFSNNFSEKEYNQISKGMRYFEVKAILGEPLFFSSKRLSSVQPNNAMFISVYSKDGKCMWADFAWKSFDIYFNNDTIVIDKYSQWWYD